MNRFLLDTHVLIYLGCGFRERIGQSALEVFRDGRNFVGVSQISFWEIAIKINIGKLEIPFGLSRLISLSQEAGIEPLPVSDRHILYYQMLERKPEHRDPFDRYLVSAAACEECVLVSSDEKFDLYPEISRIWH